MPAAFIGSLRLRFSQVENLNISQLVDLWRISGSTGCDLNKSQHPPCFNYLVNIFEAIIRATRIIAICQRLKV